jgi:hypothetical protein
MKHNTHIYIAAKAIDFTNESISNLVTGTGRFVSGKKKRTARLDAKRRQRVLMSYEAHLREATWAPDDILHDNDPNHIFKLFTDKDFPGHGLTGKEKFTRDGIVYHKFAGALPYHVDHMAKVIEHMAKLRDYNDAFELKQIGYLCLLISHYVADAHVPMHCDLRDDPPSKASAKNPSRRIGTSKPKGKYMKESAHAELEGIWDDAVTPVAIAEGIIDPVKYGDKRKKPTSLSPMVTFGLKDCRKKKEIQVTDIPTGKLMDFMIDVCIESKKRTQKLYPLENPQVMNVEILPEITREVFTEAISSLLSVWHYIWREAD